MKDLKKGDIEFSTIVQLLIAAIVLIILVGIILFSKDIMWAKLDVLKEALGLG